jgi:hypothetical protein
MSTSTVQDQYTAFAQQAQNATSAFVDAWTKSVQEAAVRVPFVSVQAATQEAIDQTFDLAGRLLEVQRSFAKQFAGSAAEAIEDAASRVSAAATEATTNAATTARTATPKA